MMEPRHFSTFSEMLRSFPCCSVCSSPLFSLSLSQAGVSVCSVYLSCLYLIHHFFNTLFPFAAMGSALANKALIFTVYGFRFNQFTNPGYFSVFASLVSLIVLLYSFKSLPKDRRADDTKE